MSQVERPTVIYVDDEPHNLVVFEAAVPENWRVITFDNPAAALAVLTQYEPALIVSDQRMPGMMGVQFLEIARQLRPNAIRIMVTGYSDEDLVVESVRKAQIFDYIKKPWDVDQLVTNLVRAMDFFSANEEARRLQSELVQHKQELTERNANLEKALRDLESAKRFESEMRLELECWVPPSVLRALRDKNVRFPMVKDLIGITYDIIKSSRLHGITIKGRPLRGEIIQRFSEAILRHGGWRESSAGDSAYGHFGLFQENENPADAALCVAREFRQSLQSMCEMHAVEVDCGIALHTAKDCTIDIHHAHLQTPSGVVTQKSFDTTSADIDLLHRMEKLVHQLPGSNIVMSKSFLAALRNPPTDVVAIGSYDFAGQKLPVEVYLILSERVQTNDLEQLKLKAA